jgi:RNA polymerase sigma-70 factor (ECF subfamily)
MSGAIEDVARKWAAAQPLVDSFISLLIPEYHDAQDVLQEVAVAVLSHNPSRGVPDSFNAWVIGIARNKAMDAHRRRSHNKLVFDSESLQLLADAHEQAHGDQGPLHDAMEQCLKRLANKARNLLEMRYQDNLNPTEIARTMGSNIGAINVALHRVRAALRECIETRLAPAIERR